MRATTLLGTLAVSAFVVSCNGTPTNQLQSAGPSGEQEISLGSVLLDVRNVEVAGSCAIAMTAQNLASNHVTTRLALLAHDGNGNIIARIDQLFQADGPASERTFKNNDREEGLAPNLVSEKPLVVPWPGLADCSRLARVSLDRTASNVWRSEPCPCDTAINGVRVFGGRAVPDGATSCFVTAKVENETSTPQEVVITFSVFNRNWEIIGTARLSPPGGRLEVGALYSANAPMLDAAGNPTARGACSESIYTEIDVSNSSIRPL